ncbi:zinc-binding dehydrogenase [Actinopolymorpha sp. B9G3]|uniref:zinc-binding dehydrogenase n=1 Tax=Actinopolymorpha sp. B9G3 TaxID=3158970 RepID=UPI0032D99E33
MRAVWLREFGGPEVLRVEETPEPPVGPGQVMIDVTYANITFVETQVRANAGPFEVELPMIMGNGVGGVVTTVGEGVDKALIGRQVVSSTGGSGGYAERVATDAAGLFDVPPGLDLDAAVALLADGRTAVMLVRTVGIAKGDRVLVEAAAGGVGTLLVQLARTAGATVVAAAGGDRKVEVARDLGAEHVVDYRRPDWAEQVREAVGGVDVVLDGVGGTVAHAAFDLLDRGGRMLSYGLASGEWAGISADAAAERGVALVTSTPTQEELRTFTIDVLAEAAAGRVRPLIGQRFPLERAGDAHAAIQGRATVGKTLLEVR